MKILFYILRNLHLPHLIPIYQWISSQAICEIEVSFTSPPYQPTMGKQTGFGIEPDLQDKLVRDGIRWIDHNSITSWSPNAIVMADADFRNGINELQTKIVNVNHGLISKGCFYSDSPLTQRENLADLICVPGSFHREALKRTVYKPVLVSGLVKFDPIFNSEIIREQVLGDVGIDPEKKVILFAPTFNYELSAVPVVTDSVRKWVDGETHLIIKLHGMSPPEWLELYRLIAQENPRISLMENLDLTPYLVAADVMVSDVSSAFMEFMALDKPVVLINNPLRTRFIGFDPRDIEYAWRDVGIEVDSAEQLPEAIKRCLANPEEKSAERKIYGPRLIGPTDGQASARIGRAVFDLLGN